MKKILMKYIPLVSLLALPAIGQAQAAKKDSVVYKMDTLEGVVVYVGYSDLRYIAKGNFHQYTVGATEVKCDTGIVSIRTEFGYLDLKKNYLFYPMDKVQPARLKRKP